MPDLHEVAAALVRCPRGILAADESVTTMSRRLERAGVAPSADTRRAYRELLVTAPGLEDTIAGIILCDETVGQRLTDGTPFPEACRRAGLLPGVKVDTGLAPLPFAGGTVVTEGLDGLGDRLAGYRRVGVRFAKWRAVIAPGAVHPRTVHANAHAMARYAALCQDAGIVPIVEPEVLMEGRHDAATTASATATVLDAVFLELNRMGVDPSGIVLKTNMVVHGDAFPVEDEPDEVGRATVRLLRDHVPPEVPGIAFLSGGQSNQRACTHLRAIQRHAMLGNGVPWQLSFSFGRALLDDVLRTWHGDTDAVPSAQAVLIANCERAADANRVSGGAWRPAAVTSSHGRHPLAPPFPRATEAVATARS